MATRLANPAPRYFYNDEDAALPLGGGKLFFYAPGTTTPKDTYSDDELTIPNTNPVVLSASGLQPNVFLNGAYRVILKDSTEAITIWDRDNVNSVSYPFSAWDASIVYGEGGDNLVTGSDGNYYRSIQADNEGNDPVSSPLWWEVISFLETDSAGSARIGEIAALTPSSQALIIGDGSAWTGTTVAALTTNYLEGLETSPNVSAPTTDIDVTAGRANDSTNTVSISLASTFVKQLDATWAPGTNQGGRASGVSLANNTWYHVFAVLVGGVADVMFDTSASCANGVANNAVTHFRCLGSIKTDGSSLIVKYFQSADYFWWDVPVLDVNSTNPSTSAVSATLTVPTGREVLAQYVTSMLHASTTTICYVLCTALNQTDNAPSSSRFHIRVASVSNASFPAAISVGFTTETNTSGQIRYRITNSTASDNISIVTSGWIDMRGK